MSTPGDQTAAKRRRAAIVGGWLRRSGWLGYAVAVGAFVAGAAGRFTPVGVTVVVVGLVVGSALLLPGIVIGLGVSAAERDDGRRGAGGPT